MKGRVRAFLDERTGSSSALARVLEEQVVGGARWMHVFGSALAVLFVTEAVTGALLMLTYTPSVKDAWSSVFFLQHRETAGWFIRGMHANVAHAMLVVMGIHFLQVVLYGAYKRPREVTWWLGLGLAALILGLTITGFRLPWDQRTFWALKVELNITGSMPGGDYLVKLIQGGPDTGQATLSRLFTLHVFLLPLLVVAVLRAKVSLIRRHGRTPPESANLSIREPVFPNQALRDAVFALIVLVGVAAWTFHTRGAGLDAPAEPDRFYPARPEWFLLPLYKLRILVPPEAEVLVTGVLPVLILGFLAALPFLDRASSRRARGRLVWVLVPFLGLIGSVALIGWSVNDDAHDKELQKDIREAQRRASRSTELAMAGVPPEGPVAMLMNDPQTRGRDVYRQYCTSCHMLDGEGKRKSPDHDGFGSRKWIAGVLRTPQGEHYFGKSKHESSMPSQKKLGDAALDAVTEFMFSLGREPQDGAVDKKQAERGQTVFRDKCMTCHLYQGEGRDTEDGPDLTRWASRGWIERQIRSPGAESQYGDLHKMPSFRDQLSDHDIEMAAAYLRMQRSVVNTVASASKRK